MLKRIYISILLVVIVSLKLSAQTGTLKGSVVDNETGEELIGATVQILGTVKGGVSDFDGTYQITEITPGAHKFIIRYISYMSDTVELQINTDQTTTHDFKMLSDNVGTEIEEVEVIGRVSDSKENDLQALTERKGAAQATEVMGADQISRGGDGTAQGALKRVTGLSVEGGKYIYVRGLSDRYSKTTLNRAEIPGLDPERNSVQMDLFPSNLIGSMSIVKTFTPDLPGSFTGGLINITTKDYPESFMFKYSSKVAYNTQASFNNEFLTYQGSSTDAFGFDNGYREIPDYVKENGVPIAVSRLSRADVAAIKGIEVNQVTDQMLQEETIKANEGFSKATQSFNKEFSPTTKTSGLNHSHSISLGNSKTNGTSVLGYNVGLTYSKANSFYNNGSSRRYSLTGNYDESNKLNKEDFLSDAKSEESVLWGALANLSYRINNNHNLSFNVLKNQNGISTVRYLNGEIPKDAIGLYQETRILRYIERSLLSNQLKGKHEFDKINLKVNWIASYTLASQETPDFRIFSNDYTLGSNGEPTNYRISPNLYPSPTRYYRSMKDENLDTKIDFELPMEGNRDDLKRVIKFGGSNNNVQRAFNEQWFVFEDYFDIGNDQDIAFIGDVRDYYKDENMTIGSSAYIYAVDAADEKNSYIGSQNITASYLMTDYSLSSMVRIVGGARFEKTDLLVQSLDSEQQKGILDNADVLPSLGLIFTLNEKQKVRASYSRTLARPTFRELVPYAAFSLETRTTVIGNPELERTLIDNYDVRWEVYPNLGELISAGAFYKSFNNPIETVINPAAANMEITWKNQDFATVWGAEIEARKSLEFISDKLDAFSVGANFTYVYSQTKINKDELMQIRATNPNHSETREMFGQSPYIVNSYIYYANDSSGLKANLSFNVSGPKLVIIQKGGTPNVYNNPQPTLDFNITKELLGKFSARFDARNLLNIQRLNYYDFKDTKYVFDSSFAGRTFALGFSYKIQ